MEIVHSSHQIGANPGGGPLLRSLFAPMQTMGRKVIAVHVQTRGGSEDWGDVFAVHVTLLQSALGWQANVRIARVDHPLAMWGMDLYLDALWVLA